jgi:ABC-type multidrug transport system fused ATPase/permease subunit
MFLELERIWLNNLIVITHRLSTIKKANKIIVLENGEIAEQGSHAELLITNDGLYAKLLKLQKWAMLIK